MSYPNPQLSEHAQNLVIEDACRRVCVCVIILYAQLSFGLIGDLIRVMSLSILCNFHYPN